MVGIRLGLADVPALAQNHRPVGDSCDVLEVVGDHDHRDAVLGSFLDQPQDVARLAGAQRGRRLVQDHDALAERDRARTGDRLTLTAGHDADLVAARDVDLQAVQQLLGLPGHQPV